MHVIRQNDKRVDLEGIALPHMRDRLAQRVDAVDQKRPPPLQQVDSEKPASAGDKGTAIIRHEPSYGFMADYASLIRPTYFN